MSGQAGCFLYLAFIISSAARAEQTLYDCLNKLEVSDLVTEVCSAVHRHRQHCRETFVGLGFNNKLVLISERPETSDYINDFLKEVNLEEHRADLNFGRVGVAARKLLSMTAGIPVASSVSTYAIPLDPLGIIGVLVFEQFQGVEMFSFPGLAGEMVDSEVFGLSAIQLSEPEIFSGITGLFGAAETESAHLHHGYSRLVELLPRQPLTTQMLELFNFMYPQRVLVKSVTCDFNPEGEVVLLCPYIKDGSKKRKPIKRRREKGSALNTGRQAGVFGY